MQFIFHLVLFCCTFLISLQAKAQNTVTIEGSITEPASYLYDGRFHPAVVKFSFDTWLEKHDWIEVPNNEGKFKVSIPIDRPMPLKCEYNGEHTLLFVSPNDDIKMSFWGTGIMASVKYEGRGAIHCTYSADLVRRFANANIEAEFDRKMSFVPRERYASDCESAKIKEQGYLTDYLAKQVTSPIFQTWARTELRYRAANRMSVLFFKSEDRHNDGYLEFARNFNMGDSDAVVSNQYLLFLDNHLRSLSMRDPDEVRQERKAKGQHWVVRGMELAKKELRGKAQEYAVARLLFDIIEGEQKNAAVYYADFKHTIKDPYLLRLAEERYAKFESLGQMAPPADAQMSVIDADNPLRFAELLTRYKGKVIFLDFWASWCAPCLSEMPYSVNLQKLYAGKDIVFVYLCADETEGKWQGNIARYQVNGDHYLMSEGFKNDAYLHLSVSTLPRYILVDKTGNIVAPDARKPSNVLLRDDINKLLGTD